MPVRIISKPNRIYIVEWTERDQYTRDRTFYSYNAASTFAMRLETRLLLDELMDLAQ